MILLAVAGLARVAAIVASTASAGLVFITWGLMGMLSVLAACPHRAPQVQWSGHD